MAAPIGYVLVKDRLRAALDRFPDLRIVEELPRVVTLDDRQMIEVTVTVYRTADDPLPVRATAWENATGKTPFVRDSEMMNCATSAVGRALGYLGFGIDASMASLDEVQARTDEPVEMTPIVRRIAAPRPEPDQEPVDPAKAIPRPKPATGGMGTITEKQRAFVDDLMRRKAHKHAGRDLSLLSREEAGELIEELKACPDIK